MNTAENLINAIIKNDIEERGEREISEEEEALWNLVKDLNL